MTRRSFLARSGQAALALAGGSGSVQAAAPAAFSFVLLGDLHFDKLEHHDLAWLEKNKGGDLKQIQNYSRITSELMPRLFLSARESLKALAQSDAPPAFVLQVGDLVEGLCGTEELALRQNREALAMVENAQLGVPFLLTKGNHDVTGEGAPAAFAQTLHPFLSEQCRRLDPAAAPLTSARYTVRQGNALFCFFDAYDPESLGWLEAELAQRKEEHCFVVIHPPVVPYGARSNWIVFSSDKQRPQREKLLALLGQQRAIVLGGHIHKYSTIARDTERGRFVQLAVSSVVNSADAPPKTALAGLGDYTPDQIRVEANYSPETAGLRRAIYEAERPSVRAFEYADAPGHAVIKVSGKEVAAEFYAGVSRQLWKRVELSRLLEA